MEARVNVHRGEGKSRLHAMLPSTVDPAHWEKDVTNEASKTRAIRAHDFEQRYFSGSVLDIGCGADLVVPHAEPFDREHGDANEVLQHLAPRTYSCVHSSHCLEHMKDVPAALEQWWELVQLGGHLVVVVPDEALYEQGIFPSLFNRDHKATFRLGDSASWSPRSYSLDGLFAALPGARTLSAERQDAGYDHSLMREGTTPWGRWLHHGNHLRRSAMWLARLRSERFEQAVNRLVFGLGGPVDQTAGPALAQIEVVAQKQDRG